MNSDEQNVYFRLGFEYFFNRQGGLQKDLAKKSGVPKSTISQVINGKMIVGIRVMSKIAAGLAVDLPVILEVGKRLHHGLPVYEEFKDGSSHVKFDDGFYMEDRAEVEVVRGENVVQAAEPDKSEIIEMAAEVIKLYPSLPKWVKALNLAYEIDDPVMKARAREAIISILKTEKPETKT